MTRITRSASIHIANAALLDKTHTEAKMKRKRSDSLGSSYERSLSANSPSAPVIDAIMANEDGVMIKHAHHPPVSPATSCSMLSSVDSVGQTIRISDPDGRHQKESHDTHLHSSSMTSVDEKSSPRLSKCDQNIVRAAKEEGATEQSVVPPQHDQGNEESRDLGSSRTERRNEDAMDVSPRSTPAAQKADVNTIDTRARVALFSSAPQRKSCDRCFRMKTKCSRAAPGASTEKPCEGCVRRGFGHDCVTSRPDFPHPKITMAKRVRREYPTPAQETNTTTDSAMSARIRAVQWSRQHTSQSTPPRRERVPDNERSTSMYASLSRDTLAKPHRESLDHGHRSTSAQHLSGHSSLSRTPAEYMHRDLVSEQQRMTILPPLSSTRQMHCGSTAFRHHENRSDALGGKRRSYEDMDHTQPASQYPELTPSPPLRATQNTLAPSSRIDYTMRNVESLRRTLYESESQDEDTARHGSSNVIRSMRIGELVSMSTVIAQELGRRSERADVRFMTPVPEPRHR